MVTLVTKLTRHDLAISSSLLTVLGTVLGLVVIFPLSTPHSLSHLPFQISFRTSSAYERYQDGRKLWTNIAIAARNLGQFIWVHVSVDRIKPTDPDANDDAKVRHARLRAIIEKRSMVNLIQAFAVSVKHFLRSEPGIYYTDLYPLLSFLPKHATDDDPTHHDTLPMWLDHAKLTASARSSPIPSLHGATLTKKQHPPKVRNNSYDPEKALPRVTSEVPLREARNPPRQTIFDHLPILLIFKPLWAVPRWLFRRATGRRAAAAAEALRNDPELGARGWTGKKQQPPLVDSNVPLEITLFLHSYLAFLLKNGLVQPAIATGLVGNLSALQDTVNNLERVRSTPIPFAYQAHLRMSLWLYLTFLPFQVISTMSWFTIPGACFASFLLLGFLEIGQEIENPFNYDENDLDLDAFCRSITRELHEITAHPSPDPAYYVFSAHNQPFAPADCRTAEEILGDVQHEYHTGAVHSISRTLLRSWKQVEEVTRDGSEGL